MTGNKTGGNKLSILNSDEFESNYMMSRNISQNRPKTSQLRKSNPSRA